MGVHRLDEMTWTDLDALERERAVVFLPVGPLEEHGPHLPLGTDVFAARDIAERASELLVERDPRIEAILAPALPVGCSDVTADFPGTISVRGATLTMLLVDVCASLARHGFRAIVISNHHLDPAHVRAVRDAREQVGASHGSRLVETASRIARLGPEREVSRWIEECGLDPATEVHADVKETSYLLSRRPDLVKGDTGRLPPVPVDVVGAFRGGVDTFRKMGADQGYVGSPHRASEELGRLYLEECARLTGDLAVELLCGGETCPP